MKKKLIILFVLSVTVFFIPFNVFAQTAAGGAEIFRQEGIASWYGREFEGRPTASGEIYDSSQFTAAHPSLPFGTILTVTNQHNNKRVTVRVNDRGPFVPARIIDVSRAAAEQLDMVLTGTAPVIVESLERIVISAPVIEQAPVVPVVQAQPSSSPLAEVAMNTFVQPIVQPAPAPVAAPAPAYVPVQVRLTPAITVVAEKSYRLQVGSFRVARNAVDAFDRLKNAGLTPAYERFSGSNNGEYFRVVIAGVRGTEVQSVTEKIGIAGFVDVLIREEN
jgi:rare lipoprotein A